MPDGDTRFIDESGGMTAPAALFRLRCWGDFAIVEVATGRDVRPRGRKTRALIAYLALHPDKAIDRERLMALLWGDRGDEQARASLRQAVFELKPFAGGDSGLILVDRARLMVRGAALATDIDGLRALAAAGDFAGLAKALPERDERLFAGLDDIDEGFDDWLRIERSRREAELTAVVADAVGAAMAQARTGEARLLAMWLRDCDAGGAIAAGAEAMAPVALRVEPAAAVEEAVAAPAAVSVAATTARQWWKVLLVLAAVVLAGLAAARWRAPTGAARLPVAIAVLPFKSIAGDGTSYVAEGVSEEILNRLARNPALKVLGRSSAATLKDDRGDAAAMGRKLGIDYLVEGSVQTSGSQLRVNVAVVRTADGMRLWSEQYRGTVADIFAIQDRIGARVVQGLDRAETAPAAMMAVRTAPGRGDAYRLFLIARGMIRDREPERMKAAVGLLREAVAIDPDYAPAWAALGSAVLMWAQMRPEPDTSGGIQEAIGYARRALALQPDLAAAHALVGATMESHKQALQHYEKAAALDPNDAETWAELAWLYEQEGDYPRTMEAWRRAVAIDPLWWMAFYKAAEWAWDMGYRDEALAYVRRVEAGGVPAPFQAYMARGDMAWRRGDFSGEFAQSQKAWSVARPGKRLFAELGIGRALKATGQLEAARRIWGHYPMDGAMFAMWEGKPPSDAMIAAAMADPYRAWRRLVRMPFMLRTLMYNGRAAEIVVLYDRRFKSPAAMRDEFGEGTSFLTEAAIVGLALRRVGRDRDSGLLLALAEATAQNSLRRGRVPRWFHAVHAEVLAARGDKAAALAALEQAVALGWYYAGNMALPDIADEPAYAAIREEPRFQRLRAKLNADVARERREIEQLAVGLAVPG